MSRILLDTQTFVLSPSDSFSLTDAKTTVVVKALSDSITVLDAIQLADSLTISEAITLTDAEVATVRKALSETVTIADAESAAVSKVLADSITVADATARVVGKTQTDSITFADAEILSVTKALADSVTLTDANTKVVRHVLSDSVTLLDTNLRIIGHNLSDTFSLADNLSSQATYIRVFSETFSFTDRISIPTPFLELTSPSIGQGLVQGGTSFTLTGTSLNMSGVQESFSSATLNPLKMADHSTGSGSFTILPGTPYGILQLDTGTTPNSQARITTINPEAFADVEITCTIPASSLLSTVSQTASMEIDIGMTNLPNGDIMRLILRLRPRGSGRYTAMLIFFLQLGGQIMINQPLQTLDVVTGSPFKLRLLHSPARVLALLSGSQVFDSPMGIVQPVIEMRVANDATVPSRLITSISRYTRIPVVTFGTEPARSLTTVHQSRVDGLTPPQIRDGLYDITAIAWAGSLKLKNAWKYFYDPNLTNVRLGVPSAGGIQNGQLTLISDPTVKGGQPDKI